MRTAETALPGVRLVHLDAFADERGHFAETWNAPKFGALGLGQAFVLDAVSLNRHRGTVRGLHFQAPPHAQAKLVRVTRGRVLDVVVDLRRSSPAFGRHAAFELAAADWKAAFIPVGFAHGFCTLENDTEVVYKLSDIYAPELAMGILWNDPDLGIGWPVAPETAVLAPADGGWPRLRDLGAVFP